METVQLEEVVREYLLEDGRDALHKFPQYLQYAINGLRDMHYDVSAQPKLAQCDLSAANSLSIPQDCIKIIKMAILGSNNNLVEIYQDSRMLANPDITSGVTNAVPYFIGGNGLRNNNFIQNGEIIGGLYGNEGGGVYNYNIDLQAGTASFSSNVSGPVYIYYLADPQRINGKLVIHPFLREPIKTWIYYDSVRKKRNVSRPEKDMAHNDYVWSKLHARKRFVSASLGEMINESRKTLNQGAKF